MSESNNALLDEYINNLSTRYNEVNLQNILLDTKNKILMKEKELLLQEITKKNTEIEKLNNKTVKKQSSQSGDSY